MQPVLQSHRRDFEASKMSNRSPAHICFEDGGFRPLKVKKDYNPYLKMEVYDMVYDRIKWTTLHKSVLTNCSRGLEKHKQHNKRENAWCQSITVKKPKHPWRSKTIVPSLVHSLNASRAAMHITSSVLESHPNKIKVIEIET